MHDPLVPLNPAVTHIEHQVLVHYEELAQPDQQVVTLLAQLVRLTQELYQLQLSYPPPLPQLLPDYTPNHTDGAQILQRLVTMHNQLLNKLQLLIRILRPLYQHKRLVIINGLSIRRA